MIAGRLETAAALGIALLASGWAAWRLAAGPPLHHPVQTGRLLAAYDLDGSGLLEAAELEGRDPPGWSWTTHDLDGDARLDPRELELAMEELDPRWLLRIPD